MVFKVPVPEAIDEYAQAIKLAPGEGVLYNNLGVVYLKMNDIDHARPFFLKSVEINGSDLSALNNLAYCYLEKNEPDKAEVLLNEILKKDSRFAAALDNLIKLRQRKE